MQHSFFLYRMPGRGDRRSSPPERRPGSTNWYTQGFEERTAPQSYTRQSSRPGRAAHSRGRSQSARPGRASQSQQQQPHQGARPRTQQPERSGRSSQPPIDALLGGLEDALRDARMMIETSLEEEQERRPRRISSSSGGTHRSSSRRTSALSPRPDRTPPPSYQQLQGAGTFRVVHASWDEEDKENDADALWVTARGGPRGRSRGGRGSGQRRRGSGRRF